VLEGPGINDNGSGTATILEVAIQMSKLRIVPRQQVRFAFWGAEESGLLGSTHYVDTLSDADLQKIYANLNFDMLGSPNYVRFVYDGDSSEDPDSTTPPGSAQIETLFNDYFSKQGLATEPTAFDVGPTTARSSWPESRPDRRPPSCCDENLRLHGQSTGALSSTCCLQSLLPGQCQQSDGRHRGR
jgi:hypothetical protein